MGLLFPLAQMLEENQTYRILMGKVRANARVDAKHIFKLGERNTNME